jgi:hypothetical protein
MLRLIVLPVTTSDILGASKGRVIRFASLYAPEPRNKGRRMTMGMSRAI